MKLEKVSAGVFVKEAITASAPGKVILFGEHFVVFGEPAIVLAIDRRAYVSAKTREDDQIYMNSRELNISGFFKGEVYQPEQGGQSAKIVFKPAKYVIDKVRHSTDGRIGIDLEIRSSIPTSAGLGSSSAVAASTAAAVSRLLGLNLSLKEICQLAVGAEHLVHGTPSGIDPEISTFGGIMLFQRKSGFKRLEVKTDLPLIVGNTGIEHSTGALVTSVREKRARYPSVINSIIKAGGKITLEAVEALLRIDLPRVGELMEINHGLLAALGVSHELLDRLVQAARAGGSYGAKLTGGGGGGCMIALAKKGNLKEVLKAMENAGASAFVAKKTEEGVKIES